MPALTAALAIVAFIATGSIVGAAVLFGAARIAGPDTGLETWVPDEAKTPANSAGGGGRKSRQGSRTSHGVDPVSHPGWER